MIKDTEATKRWAKRQGKQVTTDFILVDKDEKPQEVVRILDNDPVRKLLNRGTITQEQFEAAEMLYSDWYIGGMSPRVVKPVKMVQVDEGSPELNESEIRYHCMERYLKAMDFIRSRSIIAIVQEIVIHCQSISEVAIKYSPLKDKNVSRAMIIDRLKIGLDDLIDFY